MRRVRRISLGITTLPRSSILLTIPVAFNLLLPPAVCCRSYYPQDWKQYAQVLVRIFLEGLFNVNAHLAPFLSSARAHLGGKNAPLIPMPCRTDSERIFRDDFRTL